MFTNILVPMDLSPGGERALGSARELAGQSGGRITLLHVIQRIDHIPAAEMRSFYERLEKVARRKMTAAARRLAGDGVSVRLAVLLGDPAREIVRYAAQNRVDLIVLASHRVDPRRRTQGWGTTSYKVGILCPCPVLLVK